MTTLLWTPYGTVRLGSAPKRPIGFGAKAAPAAAAPAKKGFGFDPKRTQGGAS